MLPAKAPQCPAPVAAADGEAYAMADAYQEEKHEPEHEEEEEKPKYIDGDYSYIDLEPLVVSLGPTAKSKYLKISISLETSPDYEEKLKTLTPKFRDVLNTYLRSVNEGDLTDPTAMTRLRAQLLRRVQLIADTDAVTDVLITDFVLT